MKNEMKNHTAQIDRGVKSYRKNVHKIYEIFALYVKLASLTEAEGRRMSVHGGDALNCFWNCYSKEPFRDIDINRWNSNVFTCIVHINWMHYEPYAATNIHIFIFCLLFLAFGISLKCSYSNSYFMDYKMWNFIFLRFYWILLTDKMGRCHWTRCANAS